MNRTLERQIEWDCIRLLHQFYGYLDEKRYEDLASLFTPDGAWVRLGDELRGKDAILNAMRTRDDWLTAHVLTNARVHIIDESHAETTQYITLYRLEGHDPANGPGAVVPPIGILRHADQLVLHEGEWRFQRKTSRAIMTDRTRVTHYDRPRQNAA